MNTIPEWRAQLNRLWTVRAAIFAALLGVADQLLAPFVGALPPVVYSGLFALIIILRVWYQAPPHDPDATAPGR